MKKIVFVAVLLFAFIVFKVPAVGAQTDSMMGNENAITQTQTESDMHTESVETVLQDILSQQNISTVQELNLSEISDDSWERLGDAVMELQHPGQAHEVMDRMMGGEGSKSLRQIHINMGQAYLGYGSSNSSYGSGMMGGGMTPLRQGYEGQVGFGSMMGYSVNSGIYGVVGGLTWIALIIFMIAGAYFFIKQAGLPAQPGKK